MTNDTGGPIAGFLSGPGIKFDRDIIIEAIRHLLEWNGLPTEERETLTYINTKEFKTVADLRKAKSILMKLGKFFTPSDNDKIRNTKLKSDDLKSSDEPNLADIAKEVMSREKFITFRDNEEVRYYKDGAYVRNGAIRIKEICHQIMNGKESGQAVNEIIGKVQRSTYIDREIFFQESTRHLIVLVNGLLDLDSLKLTEHDTEYYSFTKFPVRYDPTKKCDKIVKFLSETVRPEDISVLQEWTGYNLWVFGYPAQKALILVGEGGNGKSTFIGLIEALIGKNNRSAVSLHELEENRFASHDLFGKASNLYPDLPDKDLRSTGRFKMLTGGDPIRAEDKNIKAFTFHNVAKLTFSCNKIPRVEDDTVAFFRRFIIIEFPYTFEGSDKEDRDLKEKLISDQDEMSGFLNWAIEGLNRLRSNGWHFSDGKTVEEVREEYIVRSDPYKAFVLHAVIENSDSYVLKDNLYEAYKKHCKMHKLGHKSRDSFFKNFKDLFPLGKINTERPEIDGKRVWVFRGIRLREEANWCKPLTEEETEAKVELGGGAKGGQKRQNGRPEGQGVLTVQGEAPHLAKINELEKKLKEYLEAHNGIEALSTVYSLFGEWLPGTERPDLQELIDQIKEGHRFNFNYASQNVSLVKEAIRNEYPR